MDWSINGWAFNLSMVALIAAGLLLLWLLASRRKFRNAMPGGSRRIFLAVLATYGGLMAAALVGIHLAEAALRGSERLRIVYTVAAFVGCSALWLTFIYAFGPTRRLMRDWERAFRVARGDPPDPPKQKPPALWRWCAAFLFVAVPFVAILFGAVSWPKAALALVFGLAMACCIWVLSPRTSAAMKGGASRHLVAELFNLGLTAAFSLYAVHLGIDLAKARPFAGWTENQTMVVLVFALIVPLIALAIVVRSLPPIRALMQDLQHAGRTARGGGGAS